ncbi:type VI secretion system membrane subunit TssM [Collimonas silvisoli]|uniref:type VI secretion system membrane subunit TssM n=1 Tax=Collimonas silvisoli TaxID=2825884 RepID=UPI001B8B8E24|nr:type VI secretion system membrane subunit TssM [Collimonas silvisoli]
MTNPSPVDVAAPVPQPSDAVAPAPDKPSDDAAAKPQPQPQPKNRAPEKKAKADKNQVDPALKGALDEMDGLFRHSLRQLKVMRDAGGLWRLLEGNRYVYELPWYFAIGKHGAGKTSALRNSGLKFPLSAPIALAPDLSSAQNHDGYGDWWLSDSAVLIDTAGRYITQQADAAKDQAEWHGFLGLLRKYRRRTPIDGAMVMLDIGELLMQSEQERLVYAGQLRARLHELRTELGIRFPVYAIVTKMDVLEGFADYFHALTSENRAQAWGFTLPHVKAGANSHIDSLALKMQLQAELQALSRRLEDGLQQRLRDETDGERRCALSALPQEFDSLTPALASMLDAVFRDSRFDNTQAQHALRGVYFTSAAQGECSIAADRETLLQRQMAAENHDDDAASLAATDAYRAALLMSPPGGNRSYFLTDLFSKVILPEAHLARPNLRRLLRFRLLRWIGHACVAASGFWLLSGLILSFGNNSGYLHAIADKTTHLKQRMSKLLALPDAEKMLAVPDALTAAQELPLHRGLDIDDPSTGCGYGLYSAPPLAAAAHLTYAHLEDRLLLPQIVKRMEETLTTAIGSKDAKTTYDTLRVYLQLHDKTYFNAADVKAWVDKDWLSPDSAAVFGGRASMVAHVKQLFSGERVVQAAAPQNAAMVQQARDFLNANPSTQRLYERAKAAMLQEAPQDFTLTRAVGPGVSGMLSRVSGKSLDKGVPGLFTYDGYHKLFDTRLAEFVTKAQTDDAWVMGHHYSDQKPSDSASPPLDDDPLTLDIRRQYLTDYAQHWTAFLEDIGTVSGRDLKTDMDVLRAFSAADSPLSRLARAAARETTLSRPLEVPRDDDKNLLDKTADSVKQKSRGTLGISFQERLEKELVDNRFAALREVVTGQADIGQARAVAIPAMANVTVLLNAYYTLLTIADTALASNSLPPDSFDAAIKVGQASDQLPAPFKAILRTLADSGTNKIADAASAIFRSQAQQQVDRINGLMETQVSELCKRGIEGLYPFAASANEVLNEDFTRLFAAGGAADNFFQNQLAAFVDTSNRPWKYRSPALANPAEATAAGAPGASTAGPTAQGELLKLLAQQGPNPDLFARMRAIREVFFREPGSKQMAWKVDVRVKDMDPSIVELLVDLDGQVQRYVHGPVQALTVNWPGPRGGATTELTASPRISKDTSTIATDGPWALMRLFERGKRIGSAAHGRTAVEFQFDTRKVVLEVDSGAALNPLTSDVLKSFSCPGGG